MIPVPSGSNPPPSPTGTPGGEGYYVILTGGPGTYHLYVDRGTQAQMEAKYNTNRVDGPWPTMKDAMAAASFFQDLYKIGQVVAVGAGGTGKITAGSGQAAASTLTSGPFAGLAELGHFIGSLVTHLTDAHMWISLGWLLLGLLLLVIGILLWVKTDVPKLAGVPGAG